MIRGMAKGELMRLALLKKIPTSMCELFNIEQFDFILFIHDKAYK